MSREKSWFTGRSRLDVTTKRQQWTHAVSTISTEAGFNCNKLEMAQHIIFRGLFGGHLCARIRSEHLP